MLQVIVYRCGTCGAEVGRSEQFSHDHPFQEPEVIVQESPCPACRAARPEQPDRRGDSRPTAF